MGTVSQSVNIVKRSPYFPKEFIERRRCKAITTWGTRCHNYVKKKGLCFVHMEKTMSDTHALEKQIKEQVMALRITYNSVLVAGGDAKAMMLAVNLLETSAQIVKHQYDWMRRDGLV